jgi:hypothetical protein
MAITLGTTLGARQRLYHFKKFVNVFNTMPLWYRKLGRRGGLPEKQTVEIGNAILPLSIKLV